MTRIPSRTTTLLGLALLVLLAGCAGDGPLAPTQPIAVDVSVAPSDELRAALAGSDNNEVLYALRTAAGIVEKGKLKASTASAADGSLKISLNVLAQNAVLSLQLNDAATHEPLAIGASTLNFGGRARTTALYPPYKGKPTLTLDLGAVNTNCSTFYHTGLPQSTGLDLTGAVTSSTWNDGFLMGYYNGNTYLGLEFVGSACVTTGGCASQNVAYLGNGDLVDFAPVPPPAQFYSYSSESKAAVLGTTRANALLAAGDVYCFNLNLIPGGHAWVQVVRIENGNLAHLRFRVNSYYPFYGLEETPCYNW